MELLAYKVHIQGMTVFYWLTKCVNKNHNVNGYLSHNHPCKVTADTVLFPATCIGWLCGTCPFTSCSSLCQPVIQSFFVCELKLVSSFIHPSLHLLIFLRKFIFIILFTLFCQLSLIKIVMWCSPSTCSWWWLWMWFMCTDKCMASNK